MKYKRINLLIREDQHARVKDLEINLSKLMRNTLDELLEGPGANTRTPLSPTFRNIETILKRLDELMITKGATGHINLLSKVISELIGADKRTLDKYISLLVRQNHIDAPSRNTFRRL